MTDEVLRRVEAIDRKVSGLEVQVKDIDKEQAVQKVELTNSTVLLKEIRGGIFRLFWLVAAVIVGVVVKFTMDGGFTNGV